MACVEIDLSMPDLPLAERQSQDGGDQGKCELPGMPQAIGRKGGSSSGFSPGSSAGFSPGFSPGFRPGFSTGFSPFRSSRAFATTCMGVPADPEEDATTDDPKDVDKDIPKNIPEGVPEEDPEEDPNDDHKDVPATIGSQAKHTLVKSRFSVRNVCCDAEVRLIERVITPLPGVQNVAVNSFQKICIVEHCSPCCAETILSKLNGAGLGAALLGQEGDEIRKKLQCREWCQRYTRYFVVLGTALCMLSSGLVASVGVDGLDGSSLEILAVCIGLPAILWEAMRGMKQLQLDVTFLVAISVFAAGWHGEMFDAGLVVLLFNLAKIIEAAAIRRVARSLRVVMQLQTVRTVQLASNGKQIEISELKSGDVIALRPGEQCPTEGCVVSGIASCSEAAMTGEATPHEKGRGAAVSSGTLVLNGYIEVKLTKPASESQLSEIEGKVQEAQTKRTERQMMISRFAQRWTPTVLIVALLTASKPAILGGDYAEWRHRAIVLLLIACPCAIVIGAPLATTCAIAAAAAQGVLIKRPDTVERLPGVTTVGLDKTGTLTKGEMTVLHVKSLGLNDKCDK